MENCRGEEVFKLRLKKRVNNKEKFSWKLFSGFIIFQLVFAMCTAPFILLYGPFEVSKRTFVGSADGSMTKRWLATMFLSEDEIAEITGKNRNVGAIDEVNTSLINLPKVKDDTIKSSILDENSKFIGYMLQIKDPTRVKIGYTSKLGIEGETTSQIAENYDAIAAINGGYFVGDTEYVSNGGIPTGLIMTNGEVIWNDIVNDYGVKDDSKKTNLIAIDENGIIHAGKYSLNELKEKNMKEALSLHEDIAPLIINSKKQPIVGDGGQGTAPKTMIGQLNDGSIVLVVLDSNMIPRVAATIKEAQDVMARLGCVVAVALDGGKSTTMYYDGERINNPSFTNGERSIASGFIVK